MKRDRIELLLRELPDTSTLYLSSGPRGGSALTSQELFEERLSQACHDVKFAWKYVTEYIRLGIPLPAVVTEKYMHWVYQHKSGELYHDDVTTALMFNKHSWENKEGCLKAMLRDTAMTLQDIANFFNITVQAVAIFERLFFAIRDRTDEQAYIAAACHPHTRLVEQDPYYIKNATAQTMMMIQSVASGAAGATFILGATQPGAGSEETTTATLRHNMFVSALNSAKCGGLLSNRSPAINMVKSLLVAREMNPNASRETTDSEAGLGALNITPGEAIRITTRGLNDRSNFLARAQSFEEVSLESVIQKQAAAK